MCQNVSSSNTTLINQSSPTASNQASSQSVLFSLLALGLYAMTQPSILSSYSSHSDVLVPPRSSPFICLLDSLVLIASGICQVREGILRRRQWRRGNRQNEALEDAGDIERSAGSHERTPSRSLQDNNQNNPGVLLSLPNPTALTMKVTMFFLGVLPQALKLFSIQGVPYTQTLAAFFLFSSLLSGAANVAGVKFSNPQLRKALNDLHVAKNDTSLGSPGTIRAKEILVVMALVMLLPVLSHIAVIVWAWLQVAARLQFLHRKLASFLKYTNTFGFCCLILFTLLYLLTQLGCSRPKFPSLSHLRRAWVYWFWLSFLYPFFRDPCDVFRGRLNRSYLLMRCCIIVFVAKSGCLWLSMGFSKLLQMILKAQRHKPSKQTDYMIELATFIAPPLLLREIEYKIQHESETDLDTALASTLSQVDAVFQLLDHGRERVGLKLPLDRERLFAQYLVTGMEDSHSNLSRPGRQFSLLNPEPYQNFQSSRWEVYKFKVAGKNRRYAGSKTGTIQQTFRRALIYYMSPYQQRWLRTVVGTQKVSTELEWIAFSLFNLLTAVVYYLYVFDGAATVNPSWTGIFG